MKLHNIFSRFVYDLIQFKNDTLNPKYLSLASKSLRFTLSKTFKSVYIKSTYTAYTSNVLIYFVDFKENK